MAKTHKKQLKSHSWAARSAIILWVIGFALTFLIKPGTELIWLPDFLLLLGFVPLLLMSRHHWLWLIFGLLNVFLGFVMEVMNYLPKNELPKSLLLAQAHLADYHVPIVWIILGIIAFIYGVIRVLLGNILGIF